jgi:hypothetical protein
MIIDPWKPAAEVRYRPQSLRAVSADWVDKDATAHRAADE